MSVAEIEKLLRSYRDWLKDKTTLRQVNGSWVEITTPYLDRHNDALLTLNGFGVKLNEDAIEVQATPENFPLRKRTRCLKNPQTAKTGSEPRHAQ